LSSTESLAKAGRLPGFFSFRRAGSPGWQPRRRVATVWREENMANAGEVVMDEARAEAFGGELLAALNHGALCLMLSVGHRTGLFDAMSELPASTSAEIAAAAGLDERYVREWLGAMVTARVVDIEAATGRYSLPAEHAALLTRAAGADNL